MCLYVCVSRWLTHAYLYHLCRKGQGWLSPDWHNILFSFVSLRYAVIVLVPINIMLCYNGDSYTRKTVSFYALRCEIKVWNEFQMWSRRSKQRECKCIHGREWMCFWGIYSIISVKICREICIPILRRTAIKLLSWMPFAILYKPLGVNHRLQPMTLQWAAIGIVLVLATVKGI